MEKDKSLEFEIMIIEDERDQADCYGLFFKEICSTARIAVFGRAEDALKDLEKRALKGPAGTLPKLIVLDLRLPGMGGLEFLKQVKSDDKTKEIPVVILTASDSSSDRSLSYRFGGAVFLRKPITLHQLKKVIQQLKITGLIKENPDFFG